MAENIEISQITHPFLVSLLSQGYQVVSAACGAFPSIGITKVETVDRRTTFRDIYQAIYRTNSPQPELFHLPVSRDVTV